jgi:hypothetical protein
VADNTGQTADRSTTLISRIKATSKIMFTNGPMASVKSLAGQYRHGRDSEIGLQ